MVTAPHCRVELYSALNRVRRETQASDEAYRRTCEEVERNFAGFDVVPWTTVLERAAIRALEASALRAGDALHVAAGVAAHATATAVWERRSAGGLHIQW